MKKTSLIALILVGIYTLLRNNVFVLPDQLYWGYWATSPDIFYKVLLPFVMIISSSISLTRMAKRNIFYLAFLTAIIDAINRFAQSINHLHHYIMYDPPPISELPEGYIVSVNILWPSYIMGIIEIAVIVCLILVIKKEFNSNIHS